MKEFSEELQTILKSLYTLSGFRLCVYDSDLSEVFAWPNEKTAFCLKIQEEPEGLARCRECDRAAFQRVVETGEIYVYRCCFGLCEAVAPLYSENRLAGYLMMGQVRDTAQVDDGYIFSQALPYVKDEEALRENIAALPVQNREKVLACVSVMNICAAYITENQHLQVASSDLPGQIMAYLNEHYPAGLTLEMLCTHFSRSRATLTRSFKAAYGRSIHQALVEIRLQKAAGMLSSTDASMEEIAASCGFYDQNHFTKVFRQHYQMTPSMWRKGSFFKTGALSEGGIQDLFPDA